jgi:hypothetical protein
MSDDFNTLLDFLGRCGPEVTGHAVAMPESAEAAKLQRFAAGQCDANERADACELLRRNPALLRWVAEQVRLARATIRAERT